MEREDWIYVAATLGISAGSVVVFTAAGGEWNTVPAVVFAIAYMFVPGGVGLALAHRYSDRPAPQVLGISFSINWWWVFAWLLPVAIAGLAVGAALLFPGVSFTTGLEGMIARYEEMLTPEQIREMRNAMENLPLHPLWLAVIQGIGAGVSINALPAFGEEAGWRGYLYDRWRRFGFWRYSEAVGGLWGIWHAPLILQGHNYPEHPVLGAGMMVVFCLLYSPLFTFARDKTGSTVAAAILHGTINGTVGVALIPLRSGSELLVGVTGLAGFLVLVAANLALIAVFGRRPSDRFEPSEA